MEGSSKKRAVIKFVFWTALSVVFVGMMILFHLNGKLAEWYYHTAKVDGYAVNAKQFMDATPDNPAYLEIGAFERLGNLQAVQVKKGERLPIGANGIISQEMVQGGKRVALEGDRIKVSVPWEIQVAKGFKFKDTFKHKGIRTNPWAAIWNVVMVIMTGLSLGFMAEGLTDLLGIKFHKIHHFEGH